MVRKTFIAMTAAATLALSLGTAPAFAGAGTGFGLGNPQIAVEDSNIQNVSHWVTKCRWKRVWKNGYWQRVKVCKKVWPKHYSGY
jgi:hypothetical protein